MTAKEELKVLVDRLPEERVQWIVPWVRSMVQGGKHTPPKGNLGLKKPFDRMELYSDVLADRL
jgi:hypothetical protein